MEQTIRMKISDIQKKNFKEPYNNTDIFVTDYESFEEIPIVSRYSRLKYFKRELGLKGVRDLLISLSIFVLKTSLLVSGRKKSTRDTFFCDHLHKHRSLQRRQIYNTQNIYISRRARTRLS
ncbi:hypothetical protein EGJ27_17695 [Pseudomonas sp. v388]|uniref:Imm15 family immunity protein n=1 Tax=Pseudomonas sp. v388 TaxID=2479849 RepID=UPI000F77A26A|nr:hypothetical protein EGJ27_17695 [Pseudomonas sp. v388]